MSECSNPMACVVFLRAVNVGGHKIFRPSEVARQLAKHGVISVGAAGTFVVTGTVSEKQLRQELQRCLPFETEAAICSAEEILRLAEEDPFAGEPAGPDVVHFVSVLSGGPRVLPEFPVLIPAGPEWLIRIFAAHGNFVCGLYRRTPKTPAFLGKIEKSLGGSITTRNWTTFGKILDLLRRPAPGLSFAGPSEPRKQKKNKETRP